MTCHTRHAEALVVAMKLVTGCKVCCESFGQSCNCMVRSGKHVDRWVADGSTTSHVKGLLLEDTLSCCGFVPVLSQANSCKAWSVRNYVESPEGFGCDKLALGLHHNKHPLDVC